MRLFFHNNYKMTIYSTMSYDNYASAFGSYDLLGNNPSSTHPKQNKFYLHPPNFKSTKYNVVGFRMKRPNNWEREGCDVLLYDINKQTYFFVTHDGKFIKNISEDEFDKHRRTDLAMYESNE